MSMELVGTIRFTAALLRHGSWGSHELGTHPSRMDLYLTPDRRRGAIEWDIPSLDQTEEIGLWFDEAGALVDYDGIMALPRQAVSIMRVYGLTVPEEFV